MKPFNLKTSQSGFVLNVTELIACLAKTNSLSCIAMIFFKCYRVDSMFGKDELPIMYCNDFFFKCYRVDSMFDKDELPIMYCNDSF